MKKLTFIDDDFNPESVETRICRDYLATKDSVILVDTFFHSEEIKGKRLYEVEDL